MSWTEIQGELYHTPETEAVNFRPDSRILVSPGIALAFIPNDDEKPASSDVLMSIPHHRFDEVKHVVDEASIRRDNYSLEAYLLRGQYLTYPEVVSDTFLSTRQTYLLDDGEMSFAFRTLGDALPLEETIPVDKYDSIVIQKLSSGKTLMMRRDTLESHIREDNIYTLTAFDKNKRGLYTDSEKDPWWNE